MNQLQEVVIYNNCRRSDSIIWQVADNGSDHYGSDDIDDYDDDDHDCRRLDGMDWPVARVRSAYD